MKSKIVMSESLLIALILALSGGFFDAYTYVCRGQVFANAQTGNLVLLAINIFNLNWNNVLRYLIPILSFIFGTFLTEIIRNWLNIKLLHWRQTVLGIEMILIVVVALLIPQEYNMVANVLISFICALQVQAFRKFEGNIYASTMCTGNLRSASENLFYGIKNKKNVIILKGLKYFLIVLFFILGATLGSFLTNQFQLYAVLFCLIFLGTSFLLLFIKPKESVEK